MWTPSTLANFFEIFVIVCIAISTLIARNMQLHRKMESAKIKPIFVYKISHYLNTVYQISSSAQAVCSSVKKASIKFNERAT